MFALMCSLGGLLLACLVAAAAAAGVMTIDGLIYRCEEARLEAVVVRAADQQRIQLHTICAVTIHGKEDSHCDVYRELR